MRVLLTGASGQVGGALRQSLAGHELLAPGRASFDLGAPSSLNAKLDNLSPDLIINPAAYTAVDKAEDEVDKATAVNARAPAVLARWAAARGVPLVHFSTDYVFDGTGHRAWKESDPVGPLSAYGRSKVAGEAAVRDAGGAHLIVRTAWVYASQGANLFRTVIRLARERPDLKVVADQFGTPTSARSIAAAITDIVTRDPSGLAASFARADGLIHLTNSGMTSWYGFAVSIVERLHAKGIPLKADTVSAITTADYPTRAARPANSRLDLSRLGDVFGIIPPCWEQALSDELDIFLSEESELTLKSLPQR